MNRFSKFKWHVPPPVIHVLVWLFVYLVPVVLMQSGDENGWRIRHGTTAPFLATLISFYVNYSFLIPKYLYKKRITAYVIINLIMFLTISYLTGLWKSHAIDIGVIKPHPEPAIPFFWILKGLGGLIFVNGIAISVRSTSMWFDSRDAMQKLELENVRSELSFLKMQISPHFLFNTLNNILTLIDENKELAKQTVQQLSKLLRSVIYDSEEDFVTIKQEADFLTSYSDLMRLRYGSELKFDLETDLSEPDAPIAPLLLIPMLENVFKHGIGSSVEDSSISIKITSKNGKIIFESINTYFPKTHQDKSGSGIGVVNMQKRLDLLYENRYFYDCKIVNGKYITKLELRYEPLN
ncbi:MAG: sensor histidine kinase, partial [Candidatus Fibromonas sp.]|nr:sensor histidine kinase [Candidatus Fibromonas sp.]